MALPYVTEDQVTKVKKELEIKLENKTLKINLQDYMRPEDYVALISGLFMHQDFSGKYNLTKSIASAEYDKIRVSIPLPIGDEQATYILTCYKVAQGAVSMFMCNIDWNVVARPVVFFALSSNLVDTDDLAIVSCIAKIQESASTIIRRY